MTEPTREQIEQLLATLAGNELFVGFVRGLIRDLSDVTTITGGFENLEMKVRARLEAVNILQSRLLEPMKTLSVPLKPNSEGKDSGR